MYAFPTFDTGLLALLDHLFLNNNTNNNNKNNNIQSPIQEAVGSSQLAREEQRRQGEKAEATIAIFTDATNSHSPHDLQPVDSSSAAQLSGLHTVIRQSYSLSHCHQYQNSTITAPTFDIVLCRSPTTITQLAASEVVEVLSLPVKVCVCVDHISTTYTGRLLKISKFRQPPTDGDAEKTSFESSKVKGRHSRHPPPLRL